MVSIRWITVDFLLGGVTATKVVIRTRGLVGMTFAKGPMRTIQESRLIGRYCRGGAEENGCGHKADNSFGDLHI